MAIANKTRWTETWLCGGGVQVVACRVVEDKDYNESVVAKLQPCKANTAKPQAPKMVTRERMDVKDFLAKLDADRARATR